MASQETEAAMTLVRLCGELIADNPSVVQGAALSQLMATHLCGYRADDPRVERQIREQIFALWSEMVWEMVAVHDRARGR